VLTLSIDMPTDSTWKRYLREYESIASEIGLDPKETVYEEVDQALIKRFVAQGVPFAPQYWSRGREYLRVSNDPSVYYEIVFNLDPARAYISKEYEDPIKALTVAHVLGHSHVFKNNPFEKSRTHLDVALESYVERVHEYERTYGPFLVEKAIDLAFALNPTSFGRKTKKVLDREAYQVKEVSPSEAYFVESSLGVSLDRLKRLYISGGESALRSHRIEDLCKKYGVSFQSLVDLVKRYILFSSPYTPDREIKEMSLPDGEEDLIHFFANEVDFLPDWVRDILRMEGLIYHLTHSDIPLSMVHEGFATWTHLAIMSRSSSPESWKLEAARFTSRVAVPFFVHIDQYTKPTPSGGKDFFASFYMTPNPYGFGYIALKYLESKGYNIPEFVSSVSDYTLFDHLDEDFFFQFLPKFIGGVRDTEHYVFGGGSSSSQVPQSRYTPPAGGLHENFYLILSETYRLIKEEGEEEVDTWVTFSYIDGHVSDYYLLLYSLAKYMIYNELEDPYEAIISMFRSRYGLILPRISVYTNPRSNKAVEEIFLNRPKGEKYLAIRSNIPYSTSYSNPIIPGYEIKEIASISLSSLYDSLIFLSDMPLDLAFATSVSSLISLFISLGSVGRTRSPFREVIVLSPNDGQKDKDVDVDGD